jgi:hypothetical protein
MEIEYITWQDGNGFESSKDPEGTEASQIPHLDEAGEVPGEYHKKVQPIPGCTQICVVVQNESFGDGLDGHLQRIDAEENEPKTEERLDRNEHLWHF